MLQIIPGVARGKTSDFESYCLSQPHKEMFRYRCASLRGARSPGGSLLKLPLMYHPKRLYNPRSGGAVLNESITSANLVTDISKEPLMSENSDVSESNTPVQSKADDFDFINQFLVDCTNSSSEAPAEEVRNDAIHMTEAETVNIDQSDEVVFDHEFLGMDEGQSKPNVGEVDEKHMFENIFEEYLKPMSSNNSRQKNVLSRINDSFYKTQPKHNDSLSRRKTQALSRVSSRLRDELFDRTKLSMQPTLDYIDGIETSAGLVRYFNLIVDAWKDRIREASQDQMESIYLNNLLGGPQNVGLCHEKWLETVNAESKKDPPMPGLNVLTLPTIFNRIIKNLAFQFRDGQLCLSLFNIAKQDLATYTIVCNQQTYNEVMKALWIYNGKSNLYNVETIFVEMKNNGFRGDVNTCNILKQIIIDYHQMKTGQFSFNLDIRTRIWSKDDDVRVATLEKGLYTLVNRLMPADV